MDPRIRQRLAAAARIMTTPAYVYVADDISAQLERVSAAFGRRFELSYAVKANPNMALLGHMRTCLLHLDASSVGEIERAILAG